MRIFNRFKMSIMKNLTRNTSSLPICGTLSITSPAPFVVKVELNRPEKRNAMNMNMWLDIKECFHNLSTNPDCRVIILSAAGEKIYCAGIDFQDFMGMAQELAESDDVARKSKILWRKIRTYQECITSVEACHKPVIAMVHGGCIGGGLNLICAADIRYCTSNAWFQNKEVEIGMTADVGVLQRMPKIMGNASLVHELAYTCRKFPAAEAKENGFVNRIFDTRESMLNAVLELAKTIAEKSPVAVQGTKRSLIYSRDHTVQEGLEHVALYNMAMLQSEDFYKATAALIGKDDPPVFSKL